jgi:type VI secretion system protein ImpG
VIKPADRSATWSEVLRAEQVRAIGFSDEEALLPYGPRSFQGYRLLQEYFAFPARYLFIQIDGLRKPLSRHETSEIDLMVLFRRSDPSLESGIDKKNFGLHCTPAINIFPRRADRIHVDPKLNEYQVLIDRTRPLDFEVYDVTAVTGHGGRADTDREFRRFYSCDDFYRGAADEAYYTVRREPRVESSRTKNRGRRASYESSEAFVAIVDSQQAPYPPDLRQLSIKVLATNRDLPLQMTVGGGKTDFTVESGAPVEAVRCVAGPTPPRPSRAGSGDIPWRLISHLSLNYLSLVDEKGEGANALRGLLTLYADIGDPAMTRQIEGMRSVLTRPINRRIPGPGPMAFGRGLEVTLSCDDGSFQGSGAFLLGAVLDRFFSKYVSINSFTQTVLRTSGRGEIMRWPLRSGRRPVL